MSGLNPVASFSGRWKFNLKWLCSFMNRCKVHQRAKSVVFRLVDVMPPLFEGIC